MSSASPSQTLSFLQNRFAAAGIRPKQQHGQNFLIDLNLLQLLFDSARIGPQDVVLEVGTGTGALTALLAEVAAAVISVEVDSQLFPLAQEQLARFANVTFLNADALHNKNQMNPAVLAAVRQRLSESPDRIFKLVANLPYHVATPVMSNLLSGDAIPRSMTVTIQKEVADRLRAAPATKDYGALSIWVQSQCRVKVVRSLPPTVFWPRPKVMSAIVQVDFRPGWREQIGDVDFFHKFVRAMFLHRRKFLRSVMISAYKEKLGREEVDALLAEMQLPPDARAEQIDVARFVDLAKAVQQRIGK